MSKSEYFANAEIQRQFTTWGQDSVSVHRNCPPASKPRRAVFLFPEVLMIITPTILSGGDLKATSHHCTTLETMISELSQLYLNTQSFLSASIMAVYMSPPPSKSVNSEILTLFNFASSSYSPNTQCFTYWRCSLDICT